MNNRNALSFFAQLAQDTPDKMISKLHSNGKNDYTDMDAHFILSYAHPHMTVLDVGSGTGLTINKIYHSFKRIVAIEPFEAFTQHIIQSDNVEIVNCNLKKFSTVEEFDLITMFGIVHYFNSDEIMDIYKKYRFFLKKGGRLIVKSQFGISDDVVVAGFSEELNKTYYSEYRFIQRELHILECAGFRCIDVIDIYPPECNRWDNTHFFAIVLEHNG